MRLGGFYSAVRPSVGPDGTIYAVDVLGTLHAVSPAGSLLWQVAGAGGKGLAVGADGAIYTASEDAVKAFSPDGSERWTFVLSPRAFLLVGLSVGPDGNLYAVATSGLGVFSLTPGGELRWATPELYDRPNVSYGEIVFGPGAGGGLQLYFCANAHLRAISAAGAPGFTIPGCGQPAVSPLDGSVHVGDASYRPDGALSWRAGLFVAAPADVGPDGTTYVPFLASALVALDPGGGERWRVTSGDWLGDPVVDPTGAIVLVPGSEPSAFAATLQAFGAGGERLWRLAFPPMDGGKPAVDTKVRFSPDGSRAYLIVDAAGADGLRGHLTAVSVR